MLSAGIYKVYFNKVIVFLTLWVSFFLPGGWAGQKKEKKWDIRLIVLS